MIWILSSCLSEEELPVYVPPTPVTADRDLTVVIQIPGTHIPVTYAYPSIDENEIRTVDILVFKVDASGEHYYKHIFVPAVSQNNYTTKQLHIHLEPVDTRLIVLANIHHLFTSEMDYILQLDSIDGNVDKQSLMSQFVFNFTKPWNPYDYEGNDGFPMYGESKQVGADVKEVNDIKMIRAVTRIDIVNETRNSKFVIDSVYVFNTKNKGFVAPSFDSNGAILERPHIPSAAQVNTQAFGFEFTPNAGIVTPVMEREIYVTEDTQETDQPTSIILKLVYEDGRAHFYRVDMKDKEGFMLPIRRNYRYRIHLTEVLGAGYPTAREAADASGNLSLSSTVESTELGLTKIVFNDQYLLGVSLPELIFNADGSWAGKTPEELYYSLKVYTTYAEWSASWDEDLKNWLHPADKNITGLQVDYPASCLSLDITPLPNTTGETRTGEINLRAGTLQMNITVIQYGV
jgi:hypothetical protein